eukprot:5284199-Prorocentrum_lima.AAC.1
MDGDDFSNDVRNKLAKSHLAGRHPAPVAPTTIDLVRMGDEGGCDSEEWKRWTDCCEDESF